MRYITAFWYNEHRENFVNSLKFMKARWVWLTGVKAFSIELTAILTANRLLSRAAEETDFLNGLLLTVHRRVDIQPQRCCNIRMTEHLAHALNVDPGFNAARCVGVTECVIAAFPDAAPAQNGLEVVLIGARLHWLVYSTGQDISILRQTGNSFFQECQRIRRQRHSAHGGFAFWCLDDELCFCTYFDTQYLAHDTYRAVLEVKIRNQQGADLAKPLAAVG
mgnify:CR=1 FL=1